MEFFNETGYSATLARTQLLYKDLLMATVVAKATLVVSETGVASLAPVQLPVAESDVETILGTLETEVVPVKSCCDVAVFGHAYADGGAGTARSIEIALRIGAFTERLLVRGDRKWQRSGKDFVPSEPVPFSKLPVKWELAYGGRAIQYQKLEAIFAENPAGRGYVLLPENVEGTPLPNIEASGHPIRSWRDQPSPAGFAPVPRPSSLRGLRGIEVDLNAKTTKVGPAAFSFAPPNLQLPRYPDGERLELIGMHQRGNWTFALPAFRPRIEVKLGDASYGLQLNPDALVLFPDEDQFFVVARRAFIYQMSPERLRSIRLMDENESAGGQTVTVKQIRTRPLPTLKIEPAIPPESMVIPFEELLKMYPLTEIIEDLPLCPSGS